MNKFLIIFCLLLFVNNDLHALQPTPVTPENPRCELLKNPVGVDVPQPGLSYTLHAKSSGARDVTQSAYQIWVSSTPDFKNGGDLWDSKKVMSDQMAYITYKGESLISGQKCWWKVRIWDQAGHQSSWSPTASWTMGILNMKDWKASWISAPGAEKYALSPVGFKSADTQSADAAKWVQVDLGKSSSFSEITLYPMFYADQAGYAFPVRYKVSASDDPSFKTATTIVDFTKEDFKNPRFSAVHLPANGSVGRYVRVTATRLAKKDTGYSFALRQIEVISGGKNMAAGKPVDASDNDDSNGFSKINLTDRVSDYQNFPNYSSMLLRKDFRVKPALVRATIHISGLSAYELTINGHKIGDYLLTPGWTDYRKTVLYDTYDVTPQLKNGVNAIGILLGNSVYNIQPDTTRYVKFLTTFGPAKAIAQLQLEYADGSEQTVITDKSWKASPGPITYSNLYGGEDFNANLEPAGWNKAGFIAGKHWVPALETSGPGGILKNLSAAAPPVKAIDTIAPVKINKINDHVWIYDFGQNASMMPGLRVTGPKGSRVRMIPSELLGVDGLVDRRSATQDGVRPAWWEYTLAGTGNEHYFPKYFYQGARYLQVELYTTEKGEPLPKVIQLSDVIVHSSSAPVGNFECANPLFNKIYRLVRWAQRSNMMSLMTDCPQREKMGWLEQNHLNGPSLRYNFDMALLFRKTMNDMADAQLANGFVPNIAPEYFIAGSPDLSNGMRNSPEWGSSFIIVPWQQYLFSGDVSLLERYYDRMKKYVEFLSKESVNNIIHTGLGDWYDIGPKEPWGSQLTPVSYTGTAIYYYDNWIMYQIAKKLHKATDAEMFKNSSEQIRTAFNKEFYKPATGTYSTGSQATSAMALFFNFVEEKNRPTLLNKLVADIHDHQNSFTTGEVAYRFLLRALADNGRSDIVYAMNNQDDRPGYGYQIKMGATSLTEKWDAGVGNFGSQNHFMSGQINEWLFNNLVGISPAEDGPGFCKFVIRPDFLNDLTWVKGSFASISGDINIAWRRIAGHLELNVVVPENTHALLYLPASNPKQIFEHNRPVSKSAGVKFSRSENNQLVYKLASGKYHFMVKSK
ncbi:F5/8 type C domain-containing protein [Mucilaginibacter sp. OK268]|uniref:family 78 glycoside hydrolase catalytic domain n=1 Tax=Mucilaginibacter sp. OK268 TaxID=1881048 RepID=UPI00089142A0|nr:family 78 glycoside hydrolase catalytic domain [Mucilaginibacter sp. OK268]SDP28510.1 F5/8 type C domain-containing protein [Mucilaginibacter sp. OK268]